MSWQPLYLPSPLLPAPATYYVNESIFSKCCKRQRIHPSIHIMRRREKGWKSGRGKAATENDGWIDGWMTTTTTRTLYVQTCVCVCVSVWIIIIITTTASKGRKNEWNMGMDTMVYRPNRSRVAREKRVWCVCVRALCVAVFISFHFISCYAEFLGVL